MVHSHGHPTQPLWYDYQPSGQPSWDGHGFIHDPVLEPTDYVDYGAIESRMAFTGAETGKLTDWVNGHGNQMERIAWLYACATIASGYRITGIELGEDYGDERFDARYRQARKRLRDKLLKAFAENRLLVAAIKELLPTKRDNTDSV